MASSPTVLLTLPLPQPAASILQPFDMRVLGHLPSHDELCTELAKGVDVLCPQLRDRIDGAVMDAGLPRLRAICNYAVGYDNIDIAAATARGIVVSNTPGVLTNATADCALGLMLAAARRLCEGDYEMRSGKFTGWEPEYLLGLDLNDALLGIVGFGRIGQALARRALAMHMRVAYVARDSTTVPDDLLSRVIPLSFDELVERSDVISLHVPLSDSTRHLINENVLRAMKPTAILVNTARGPIVDEAALVRALQEKWIGGAGLDVYESEPQLHSGLAECRNAVLAPHLGSATVKTRAAMAELCATNARAALQGKCPPNAINPAAWSVR